MAKVSVRCSIPGDRDYHMLYDDLTIEGADYPQLEGLKGDELVCCLQFLATRQILIWHVAMGHYSAEQFKAKLSFVENLLVPKHLRIRTKAGTMKDGP